MEGDRVDAPVAERRAAGVAPDQEEARVAKASPVEHRLRVIDPDDIGNAVAQVRGGVAGAAPEVQDEAAPGRQLGRHAGAVQLPDGLARHQIIG